MDVVLIYAGGSCLLLCLAVVAAWCAPFAAACFIGYVVRSINRRDDMRADDVFRDVPPEVLQNLTPHQRDVLESVLLSGSRRRPPD